MSNPKNEPKPESDFEELVKKAKPFGLSSAPAGTISLSGILQKSSNPDSFVLVPEQMPSGGASFDVLEVNTSDVVRHEVIRETDQGKVIQVYVRQDAPVRAISHIPAAMAIATSVTQSVKNLAAETVAKSAASDPKLKAVDDGGIKLPWWDKAPWSDKRPWWDGTINKRFDDVKQPWLEPQKDPFEQIPDPTQTLAENIGPGAGGIIPDPQHQFGPGALGGRGIVNPMAAIAAGLTPQQQQFKLPWFDKRPWWDTSAWFDIPQPKPLADPKVMADPTLAENVGVDPRFGGIDPTSMVALNPQPLPPRSAVPFALATPHMAPNWQQIEASALPKVQFDPPKLPWWDKRPWWDSTLNKMVDDRKHPGLEPI